MGALGERDKLIEKRRKKTQQKRREEGKDGESDGSSLASIQSHEPPPTMQQQIASRGGTHEMSASLTEKRGGGGARQPRPSRVTGTGTGAQVDGPAAAVEGKGKEEKKKGKEKKFCMLPSKVNGVSDATWVGVHMDGMDEVGAHCGLFLPGPHYDRLVGDVASRVIGWVQDDMTKKAILSLHERGVA
jgi:hypothetical protein